VLVMISRSWPGDRSDLTESSSAASPETCGAAAEVPVCKMYGPLPAVRGERSLEEVFVQVVGGRTATGSELAWL